jgi:YD repeat-containing protein
VSLINPDFMQNYYQLASLPVDTSNINTDVYLTSGIIEVPLPGNQRFQTGPIQNYDPLTGKLVSQITNNPDGSITQTYYDENGNISAQYIIPSYVNTDNSGNVEAPIPMN